MSNNIQSFINEWSDTLQVFDILGKEIIKITQICNIEAKILENENEDNFLKEIQPWYRIAIRSIIATVEAICFKLKYTTVLICDQRKKLLTQEERDKLLEKKLDEQGELRDYYLKTRENIKLALKKFYYAFYLEFAIKNHEEWKKLCNTIGIRNKLTHQKKKNDLKISAQMYQDAAIGFKWFRDQIKELNNLIEEKKQKRF